MWTKALVAMSCLLLGGCGAFRTMGHGDPPDKTCNGKVCTVYVDVTSCTITTDTKRYEIKKGNKDVEIVWEIRTKDVVFANSNEVFLKPGQSDPAVAGQFSSPRRISDKKFSWKDANTAAGETVYGITVVQEGTKCLPLDPVIINDA